MKTRLLLALPLIFVGCASVKPKPVSIAEHDGTKQALEHCIQEKAALSKSLSLTQMSQNGSAEAARKMAVDLAALRKKIADFQNHPHTCKHKHLLD